MADEQHGIEIGIDSTQAEAGKNRVIKSIDQIKQATNSLSGLGLKVGDGYKNWSQAADRAAKSTTKSMDQIRAAANKAGDTGASAARRMENAFNKGALGIDRMANATKRLQPNFAQIEASYNRMGRMDPFKGPTASAGKFGAQLLNLRNIIIGVGMVELGKSIVNTEAQFRGFDQALKIVTGSTNQANKEMAFAEGVANRYGLRIKDLTASYVGLLAASRGTNMEGLKSREVFDAVTKAGVAYGLSNDNIRGSLLAIQQMMSKGTVQAEELRGQLGERLPGAFQVAARAMGVTTQELGKMLEAGKVVSSDFLPKFAAQLQKEIPDGAKSAYSGFNAFLNELDRAVRVLANSGIFKGLTDGAKGLGDALQSLVNDGSLAKFGQMVGSTIGFLGNNIGLLKNAAIAYGIYFASIKIGVMVAFVSQLVALEIGLGATTTAAALGSIALKGLQAVLMTLMSPLVLVTAGIAGLVFAFMSISSAGKTTQALVNGIGQTLKDANLAFREASQRAGAAATGVAAVGTGAAGAVGGINSFAGAVGNAAQQLYNLAKAKQAAAFSELVAGRNKAAVTFNQLRAQSDVGLAERSEQARRTASGGSGLARVGNIVRGVGQAFGVATDTAAKTLGFGPDEGRIRKSAEQAALAVKFYDKAIVETRKSLEQFVTAQDRTSVATTGVTKPSVGLANALAQQAGAITDVQKATANLAVVKATAGAELKAGTITQAQYTARVGDAIRAVNELRESHKSGGAALAAYNKKMAEGAANQGKRQGITDRYDEQPRFLDIMDKDKAALGEMVGEWIQVGDAVVRYTDAMKAADTATLNLAANKPFDNIVKASMEELAIQQKILQGRHIEAEALQQKFDYERQFGKMLPEQYKQLLAIAAANEQINRALEDQRRQVEIYVGVVDDLQSAFERFLNDASKNPFKASVNFLKDAFAGFKNMMIKTISNDIFGGLQREVEDMVSGQSGVDAAVKQLADETLNVTSSVADIKTASYDMSAALKDGAKMLRDAANYTGSDDSPTAELASLLAKGNGVTGPNMNGEDPTQADIVVMGKKLGLPGLSGGKSGSTDMYSQIVEKFVGRLSGKLTTLWNAMPKGMQGVLKGVGGTIQTGLAKIGIKLPSTLEGIGATVGKAMKGAGMGMMASGIVNSLGLKQSQTGAAIGGAIGSFLPIPGGNIIGGIVGGTIGGLFMKPKSSSASFGADANGANQVTGAQGSNAALKAGATGNAKAVLGGLGQIASQLGGSVTGTPNVTIGTWDGKYRVASTTTNDPLHAKSKAGKAGLIKDFGTDGEAAAIAYAIQLAVKQGVITGITDASKRVLSSSNDTEAAVAAATIYEQLHRQAAMLRDPIKGAFDEFKRGMDNTITQLKQAGYSADEIAQVQVVFQAQQKQMLEEMTSGYQSFLDMITKGPDSGLTIFDQFGVAQKDFAVAKAGLADGSTTQDEFTNAGQKLFDLARQTYGTATPEFEAVKATLVSATEDALRAVQQANTDMGVVNAVTTAAASAAAQRTETNNYLAQIAASMAASGTAVGTGASGDGANYYGKAYADRMNY